VDRRPWRPRLAAIASAVVFLIAAADTAHADTCTWTGNGASNLWSLSANWACSGTHFVPQDGDSLAFLASAPEFTSVNDLTGLIVQTLTIQDYRHQLSGNGIFLNQELTASSAVAGTLSVSLPVTLLQPNTEFLVAAVASADLLMTGPITSVPGASLIKSGSGVLTLSNPANSWEFAAIDDGVLRLGAAGALPDSGAIAVSGTLDLNGFDETIGTLFGPGTVALGGNTLTVSQNATAAFEGVMTGTGGLIKTGTARLTLGGAASNTFTGTTTVTAGELRLAKTSSAQAISGPLVINGGAVFTDLLNQLLDTVPITVNAPGQLTMVGMGGTIENIGSLSGNGTVTLTGHTLTVGFNNQSTVFTGNIVGTGAFLGKFGTGTLVLTGTHTVTGTTSMYGGGLIVNGSLPSRVYVSDGLIGGTGSINEIAAGTGFGSIAPGPAPGGAGTGILSTTSATLGSAMALVIDVNGPVAGTGYDRLAVSGPIAIGNAALVITRGYVPAANATFTIIDNTSATPVNGTFAGLPQNSLLFVGGDAFRISYTGGDGNDVVLTALPQPAFSISDVTVTEGRNGSVNAVFTVSTPTVPFQTVSVQFATVNESAESPQDFTAHSGTLTFLPGTTSQTVTIAVHGDVEPEATETFIVRLSGAQGGATIEDEDGVGTIETDDAPDPPLTYYLAEGATGAFFDNDVLIANPYDDAAPITLTFYTQQGATISEQRTLPGRSRTTIHVDQIQGLEDAAVSVVVKSESGQPLTVERTMFWDSSYYGGHTGTAVDQPATRWFFAEAAQGFFDTYVLVTNANPFPTDVTVTFLREGETPVVKTIPVEASSRATIGAGAYPELEGRSFGLIVDATQPVIAERSMYFGSTPTRAWSGGHESPGVSQASTSWFHAEGATGAFFDTFILLGNPGDDLAKVTLDFLLESGETVSVQRDVPAKGRITVPLESVDDPRMQNGAVSTVVTSDRPIVSERSTYWAGDAQPWGEGHNSFGLTQTATSWGLAEGRVGGTHQFATYILLANPSLTETADVLVTYLRETGTPVSKTYQVQPGSRYTIDTGTVPELQNGSFGSKIFVTNGVAIAVERSMYWNANGVFWAGGSHAPAQRLP
jgi:autotransporter-associated beta strand protein